MTLAGAIFGVIAGYALPAAWKAVFPDAPPMSEQIAQLRAAAASDRRHPAFSWRGDLHGDGAQSLIMVLRANEYRPSDPDSKARSDELAVFDRIDGRLRQRFRFQPQRLFDKTPYLFRLAEIRDVDRDGRPEFLGAYDNAPDGGLTMPLVLQWRANERGYKMSPLLTSQAPLNRREFNLIAVREKTTLRNLRGNERIVGYPTHGYAVFMDEALGQPVLATTYLSDRFRSISAGEQQPCPEPQAPNSVCFRWAYGRTAEPAAMHMYGWTLDLGADPPIADRCIGKPALVRTPINTRSLQRAWLRYKKHTIC